MSHRSSAFDPRPFKIFCLAVLLSVGICGASSPSDAAVLSGVLRDQYGTAVPNQWVFLYNPSYGRVAVATDTAGVFVLDVAPESYVLTVSTNNPYILDNSAVPQNYGADVPDFDLTTNRIQDLTLPTISVNVRVEDRWGRPVPGALVYICQSYSRFEVFPGGGTVDGASCDSHPTDGAGMVRGATLFPNAVSGEITVTPPPGSSLPAMVFSTPGANGGETFTTVLGR